MKHNMNFKHTGKCFRCGKDTKLLIHKDCHTTPEPKIKKKKLSNSYINYLSRL